jgi:methylthioribose-1-phosphate isomerase
VPALEWNSEKLTLIDQTKLPTEVAYITTDDYRVVAKAIKELQVRGAPAIGAAAAFGLVLGAKELLKSPREDFVGKLTEIASCLKSQRPTAVNLFWAIDRMLSVASRFDHAEPDAVYAALEAEARKISAEDVAVNKRMGTFGAELIQDGAAILTHCNAGQLATVDFGTALGVIRAARQQGKNIQVYADETRPLLQGARLTTWELMQDNIPVTLITDNMAGFVMKKGLIDCVIVGADRITANGDVANKIGTYAVAVLAKEHNIPFYVAAPLSTFDFALSSGELIPIEERSADEVTHLAGKRIAPEGVRVFNPAFDVTPHKYLSAIITEKGVVYPPYAENLAKIRGND